MTKRNKFTCLFANIGQGDVGIAGGKGASLGQMTQAGLPVPPGFVVTTRAFEEFLSITNIVVELDSILHKVDYKAIHSIEEASARIQSLILSADIPSEITGAILQQYMQLGAELVAIRSSATSEDSAEAAWAGQLDTYLNITEKNLLEHVKKCWASLFNPRTIFYRFERGLHNKKIAVAVVIQKMIQSEVSGVAFSVHPITEDYNQLVIEAGLGLGEAIVAGYITPDSYVIEKTPRYILDKNIATQIRSFIRASDGAGNQWVDLSQRDSNRQKLSDGKILELTELIIRIEKHYGYPCDIEWAYEKNSFYITQSRPITTLKRKDSAAKKDKDTLPDQLTKNDDQSYQLHFSQSEFGVLMLDILLGQNSYGVLDYRSLTEQEVSRVYLTRRGRKEAYQLGKDLLDKSFYKILLRDAESLGKKLIKYHVPLLKENTSVIEWDRLVSLWDELWHITRYCDEVNSVLNCNSRLIKI